MTLNLPEIFDTLHVRLANDLELERPPDDWESTCAKEIFAAAYISDLCKL